MIGSRAARSLSILAAIACGCPVGSGPGDDDSEAGSTGAAEPPPMPDFTEPASGRIDVPLARVEDVALGVTGITPGNTRLLVDGIARGSLDEDDPSGTLTTETLVLRLRGAMVSGVHTMQLASAGGEEPLVSSTVEVHLAATGAPPGLVAEPQDPALPGHAVLSAGAADRGLLAILDATDPDAPTLVVAPLVGDAWDLTAARRVSIPGYRQAAGDVGLSVALERVGSRGDAEADRLRVAWRVGSPGVAVDLVDAPWAEIDETSPATRVFDLDPDVLGPYEHAELRRPALLGDTIVAEALAATDIEAPRPGDLTLLQARLHGTPAVAHEPTRVVLGDRQDIDAIGPVLDSAGVEVGAPPVLGARLDGRVPVVVTADPSHGRLAVVPSVDDGRGRALTDIVGPLSTVLGAFGSRRVAARVPGDPGRIRLVEIDDWGTNGVIEHSIAPDTLPDPQNATADLAVVPIAGHAVWLVPHGPDVPVHAVITGGDALLVQPLEGLFCVGVAVAFDPRDPAAPRPLACATGGGQITTARLRLETGA